MNLTISGLIVASALMTVGSANAFARHDLFERTTCGLDARLDSASDMPRAAAEKSTAFSQMNMSAVCSTSYREPSRP